MDSGTHPCKKHGSALKERKEFILESKNDQQQIQSTPITMFYRMVTWWFISYRTKEVNINALTKHSGENHR